MYKATLSSPEGDSDRRAVVTRRPLAANADSVTLDRLSMHQCRAQTRGDDIAMLVKGHMFELNQPCIRAGLAVAKAAHCGARTNGIAVKHRFWETHVGHAEVRNGGSQRGVVDGLADHEACGVEACHHSLTEFGSRAVVLIEMDGRHIHCERAVHHVIHFCDGAGPWVVKGLPNEKLFEVEPGHRVISLGSRSEESTQKVLMLQRLTLAPTIASHPGNQAWSRQDPDQWTFR